MRIAQDAPLARAPSLRAAFDRMPAPVVSGRIRILSDNMDAWATRWRMIEQARHRVDVQYFIIEADAFGLALLGLLDEKRQQGADVRLMVDSRGTPKLSRAFAGLHLLDQLAGDGIEVRVYNTVETQLGAAAHGDLRKLVASNHDKLIIVDDRTSILGGRNISADYLSDPRDLESAFIDMDVVIEGTAAAAALTRAFTTELHTKNAISVKAGRSDDDTDALGLATAPMRTWLNAAPFSSQEIEALRNPEAREALALELEGTLVGNLDHIPSDGVRALVRTLTTQLVTLPRLRGALRTKTPHPGESDLEPVHILDTRSAASPAMRDRVTENLLVAIDAAEHDVVLQSPYLILSERGMGTLEAAARRGVHVTFFTNSPVSSDSPITQAAFLQQWPEILARVPTARLFVVGIDRVMHAKVSILDGTLSFVGSYNLDPISAHTNGEVVSVVWSQRFAGKLQALISSRIARKRPGVFEYTIRRDDQGAALRDGDGHPIVSFGPDDHCDAASLAEARAQDPLLAVLAPFF